LTGVEVARHLNGKKTGRGRWLALCPSHDDRKPSLSISEGRTGVLLRCQSHNCNFLDVVKAAGLQPLMLRYDYDPAGKFDQAAFDEMHRKRREVEEAEAKRNSELRYWHDEVNRWEYAAALLFTNMLTLGRSPQALRAADVWHKVLHVARMRRESLWSVQIASGVPRSKLGEVDCYTLEAMHKEGP
jgi:hypothetical protein